MARETRPPSWLRDSEVQVTTKQRKMRTENIIPTEEAVAAAQSLILSWNHPTKTALKEAYAVHGDDWSKLSHHMFEAGFYMTASEAQQRVDTVMESGEWRDMPVEWLMEF